MLFRDFSLVDQWPIYLWCLFFLVVILGVAGVVIKTVFDWLGPPPASRNQDETPATKAWEKGADPQAKEEKKIAE